MIIFILSNPSQPVPTVVSEAQRLFIFRDSLVGIPLCFGYFCFLSMSHIPKPHYIFTIRETDLWGCVSVTVTREWRRTSWVWVTVYLTLENRRQLSDCFLYWTNHKQKWFFEVLILRLNDDRCPQSVAGLLCRVSFCDVLIPSSIPWCTGPRRDFFDCDRPFIIFSFFGF